MKLNSYRSLFTARYFKRENTSSDNKNTLIRIDQLGVFPVKDGPFGASMNVGKHIAKSS